MTGKRRPAIVARCSAFAPGTDAGEMRRSKLTHRPRFFTASASRQASVTPYAIDPFGRVHRRDAAGPRAATLRDVESDSARRLILARRARFMAATLASVTSAMSLGVAVGCKEGDTEL